MVFFGSRHSEEFHNIRSVINFYAKALKRFPEKYFRGYYGFAFIGQIIFSRNFKKLLKQER